MDRDTAYQLLERSAGIAVQQLETVWEPCEWSQTFRVIDSQAEVYFLKCTPRSRSEAFVTQILHEYGAVVPAVLNLDLLPDHAWRWFLMPDMGTTDDNALSRETALQTAYCLGHLQRQVINDNRLPRLMPQCLPTHYLDILQSLGLWIENSFPEADSDLVEIACSTLPARKQFFDAIADTFARVDPTCVHGDLWSGNIAVNEQAFCLLDWGDAVWGTGTSSIVNLLISANGTLPAIDIWDAYAEGWQQAMSSDIIRASQTAHAMTSLIIERKLAQFQPAQAAVPIGIRPLLESLVALSA